MPINNAAEVLVSQDLLDAIAAVPTTRTVSHCGSEFAVPPFDIARRARSGAGQGAVVRRCGRGITLLGNTPETLY